MDTDDRRPSPEIGVDWLLLPDSRERIVNKITETLKKHISFSGEEGLAELKKFAVLFEEKIYTNSMSQSDYLRKIAFKMCSLELKSQNTISNSLQPNPSGHTTTPLDSQVSLDSTAQIGHSSGGDWKEEVQQKIKAMKEMYLPELNEMHQQIALRLQQHDSLPQPFTGLDSYEKQIINFINSNKARKSIPPQQGQLGQLPQMQQSQSQVCEVQSHDNQINPQTQSMNLPGSVPNMVQNDTADFVLSATVEYLPTYFSSMLLYHLCIASLDSTAETGHSNGDDWREEIHQKIKAMNEKYFPQLHELYLKISSKLQMLDSHPQQPKSEKLEDLKKLKCMVVHLLALLQVSKTNISPRFKEKLGPYEKQIIQCIQSNKGRRSIAPQQGQLGQPQMQKPQSQACEVQSHENQNKPRIQSINLPGSVPNMLQKNMAASPDSTPQTGNSNGSDWQSKGHQKDEQIEKLKLLNNHIHESQSQTSSIQSYENQMYPQINWMTIQGSAPTMQQKNQIQQPQAQVSEMQIHKNLKFPGVQGFVPTMQQKNHIQQPQYQVSEVQPHDTQKFLGVQGSSVPTMKQKNHHIQQPEAQVVLQMQFDQNQMKEDIKRMRIQASELKIWQNNCVFGVCAILLCFAYLFIYRC
ncbi:Mediator of RNA polymerase II transcription subunit 15a [Euphorbia peplus]|nr:Mediator of RNA polymerase II transcription subunit 15a [Euphorbia peplus]